MRKLFIILICVVATCAACDVLDVKPQSSIPASDAFKDKAGIEMGILGAYMPFQYLSYYGRSYQMLSDLSADNLDFTSNTTGEWVQIDINNILPENGTIANMWASAYEGINNANNVIVKVPQMSDMTPEEKNVALGELYFIRALNHFNLLSYFGAIAIKTTPTVGTSGINVPRNSVSEVYAQIIEDLEFAEVNLPQSSVKVRATKYAATALLARVHLYAGNYEDAVEKATDVIEIEDYQLIENNYRSIFDDGSAETIFAIDFVVLARNRIAEQNFPLTLKGKREAAPSASILSAYEPGDLRYSGSLNFDSTKFNPVTLQGVQPYPIKYPDLATGAENVIVLRLAEMYLIRAEAEARLEGNVTAIQNDINVIRERAGLDETTTTSYADLLLEIEQERRVEFAFEGHRWFDLVRTGKAVAVLPNVTDVNQTLYPIPLSEILTNKNPDMKQNPGY